jgi:hypothetical protein
MKIRVTRGTVGIAVKRDDGRIHYMSKSAGHGAFDIDADQAKRLIEKGVAEKVVEDFNDMTIAELKELGESEGISFKGCKNKSDYIARIEEAEKTEEESVEDEIDDEPEFDPLNVE